MRKAYLICMLYISGILLNMINANHLTVVALKFDI